MDELMHGRESHTAEGREDQALNMLLVPYRPSDNPPKLKQIVPSINSYRNAPTQLRMFMNYHSIYGSPIFMVMLHLYNGDCLATANKFTPKLAFEPLDKLKTYILAKPHLRDIPSMDDHNDVIQEYIYNLIRVYMKMLIFEIDSNGMRLVMARTTIPSYNKVHEVFTKLCEQGQYVDGPIKEIIDLISKEFMHAVNRFDAKQALSGVANIRNNGLRKELLTMIDFLGNRAEEDGLNPNKVELLFDATREIAKQMARYQIDSGEGSEYVIEPLLTDDKSTALTIKSRDQAQTMTHNNRGIPRNALNTKKVLFTSSGPLSTFPDGENGYDEHFPGRPTSESFKASQANESLKDIYYFANHQDELPARYGHDVLSFAQEKGFSPEEALDHAQRSQQVFIDAEHYINKENSIKADEEAERLRKESVEKQERTNLRNTVIQAAKAELLPLVRREVDSMMHNTEDDIVSDRDNYSDSDNPFANSGPLVSMQPRRNNYQFTEQNQGIITPFDIPYPPLGNSATFFKKPNSTNSHGQLRSTNPHISRPVPMAQYLEGFCITCGQTPAECREMRPSAVANDPAYNDRCYLRDHPMACRIDLNINILSPLRLAALSSDKLDRVLASSHRNGCLKGAPYSIIAETKANILSEKESLSMVLANRAT